MRQGILSTPFLAKQEKSFNHCHKGQNGDCACDHVHQEGINSVSHFLFSSLSLLDLGRGMSLCPVSQHHDGVIFPVRGVRLGVVYHDVNPADSKPSKEQSADDRDEFVKQCVCPPLNEYVLL